MALPTVADLKTHLNIPLTDTSDDDELQEVLGQGNMSTVFRAVHARSRQVRAIKVLSSQLAQDASFVRRFQHDAEVMAQVRHPNIVQTFGEADEEGFHYLVMEMVEGVPLVQLLKEHAPFSIEVTLGLLRQMVDAIDYAHAQGVVHGDL